jgi:hypothetical protein
LKTFLTPILALLLANPAARAAVLIHEYALRGSLADNRGNSPLAAIGGQITALGYIFAANQSLTLSSPVLNSSSFSLELSFRFDAIGGYRKIADFHDRGDDTGFYALNANLNFYPVVTAGPSDFLPDTDVHVVLTRDGITNVVTGYVNGQQRFTFNDTGPLATLTSPDRKLTLFADDFATGQGEAAGGTVNYVRVFNGALTATEVSALYAAGPPLVVPEPATHMLLGLGGVVLLGSRFRRLRRRFT